MNNEIREERGFSENKRNNSIYAYVLRTNTIHIDVSSYLFFFIPALSPSPSRHRLLPVILSNTSCHGLLHPGVYWARFLASGINLSYELVARGDGTADDLVSCNICKLLSINGILLDYSVLPEQRGKTV